ncbi:hypothetical protein GG344DRAFT_61940 [Lentinula edodes]|nr:hypothetical protein GG344DRAFT_61940 [Lentinula edodes]
MLTLSSLRLFKAMFLLLVPFILVVTAAPLMDVDMAVQVEKRGQPLKIKRSTIGITHTHCADPLIFVNTQRAYSPQAKPNSDVFTGVAMRLQAKNIIAVIDLTMPQKNSLYKHIEENITGTSEWDYILRVMQYLEKDLASFQFISGGKEKWEEMWNVCKKTTGLPAGYETFLSCISSTRVDLPMEKLVQDQRFNGDPKCYSTYIYSTPDNFGRWLLRLRARMEVVLWRSQGLPVRRGRPRDAPKLFMICALIKQRYESKENDDDSTNSARDGACIGFFCLGLTLGGVKVGVLVPVVGVSAGGELPVDSGGLSARESASFSSDVKCP